MGGTLGGVVANAAAEPRTVLVEQPRRSGWTIENNAGAAATEAKPVEITPSAYRFRVETGAKQSSRLHINEHHTIDDYFRLVDSSGEQLNLYLHNANASPALLRQLEPILASKRTLAVIDTQLDQRPLVSKL